MKHHPCRPLEHLVDLDGQEERSGDDRKPLRPHLHAPQTVRLDETHGRVEECESGQRSEPAVVRVRRGLDEDPRVMASGVQV